MERETNVSLEVMAPSVPTGNGKPPELSRLPEAYCRPELTPLKAIHARCIDCTETINQWRDCLFDGERDSLCPLWPYRLGKNPSLRGIVRNNTFQRRCKAQKGSGGIKPTLSRSEARNRELDRVLSAQTTPLRAVRSYCLWCCDDQPKEVRLCLATDCPLWAYRFGHKPKARADPLPNRSGGQQSPTRQAYSAEAAAKAGSRYGDGTPCGGQAEGRRPLTLTAPRGRRNSICRWS